MIRSALGRFAILISTLALSTLAQAQYAGGNGSGWEGGLDLIYQNATSLNFKGGTTANLDTDWGLSATFGYRVNPHIEAQFALDWANVDYRANLALGTGQVQGADGTFQSFTPRVNFVYNILDRPLTPFVVAGIGYSFIDTSIPDGRPQSGCWWDPWYGYVCSSVQSTKTTNGFAYQAGFGARWDVGATSTLRLSFQRDWLDLGSNAGTPAIDQIRLGYSWRYF